MPNSNFLLNRRDFLRTSAVATLAASLGATGRAKTADETPKPPPAPLAGTTPPVLQNMSETAATVFWSASRPATGWVEFGETEALGQIASGAEGGLLPYDPRVLRVRLTGLRPGRKYFYRTQTAPVDFAGPYDIRRGEAVASPIHRFTTFNAAAEQVNFVVWNDTHQNNVTLAKLARYLPDFPADFLLWNGDIFNDVRDDDMLIAETLHPAGQEYAATRPLVFARGNHDVRGAQARSLGRALEAPEGKYYFAFRQGPVALVVLDTGEDKADSHPEYGGLGDFTSYRAEQRAWLAHALDQAEFRTAPFRVLVTHIPLRGFEESKDSRAKWEALLRPARFDFAFSGHTHRHAYNEPSPEQPWPLLVGGGPKPEAATFIHVQGTAAALHVRMYDLERKELGRWDVARRG